MNKPNHKQLLQRLIKEAKIQKIADESLKKIEQESTADGQKIADDIFDKLLQEIVGS